MKTLFFISLIFLNVAYAKLASSQFVEFISESEVILDATPMKAEWQENHSGTAQFRVNRVMKGQFNDPSIQISWSSEVHDQRIDSMGVDWILFLKKDKDGKYIGTHYGRSYWPLTTRMIGSEKGRFDLEWHGRGAFYQYPVTMLKLSAEAKKSLISKKKNDDSKTVEFISVKSLVKFLGRSKEQ